MGSTSLAPQLTKHRTPERIQDYLVQKSSDKNINEYTVLASS